MSAPDFAALVRRVADAASVSVACVTVGYVPMTGRLSIDDDPRWTPCSAPGCVWRVLTDDHVPISCGAHWDGTHLSDCEREKEGWCTCHEMH